jgi:hypothetical protein
MLVAVKNLMTVGHARRLTGARKARKSLVIPSEAREPALSPDQGEIPLRRLTDRNDKRFQSMKQVRRFGCALFLERGMARGPGGASTEAGFAVPMGTVIGSANGSGSQALGGGAALHMTAIRLDRQASLRARRVFSCHRRSDALLPIPV